MLDDDWEDIWFTISVAVISITASFFLWAIYEAWR